MFSKGEKKEFWHKMGRKACKSKLVKKVSKPEIYSKADSVI